MAHQGKTPLGAIFAICIVLVLAGLRRAGKRIRDALAAKGFDPPPIVIWLSLVLMAILIFAIVTLIVLAVEGNSN